VGQLRRLPIARWRSRFGLEAFVETGTWRGDGLLYAVQQGFRPCFSIEAHPGLALAAEQRLARKAPHGLWEIVIGDSAQALAEIAPRLGVLRTLWWLDAHLPEDYGAEATRIPLLAELRAILARPSAGRDVIAIDDLRLFRGGSYGSGAWPGGKPFTAVYAEAAALLGARHRIRVRLEDEGYLIALPAGTR